MGERRDNIYYISNFSMVRNVRDALFSLREIITAIYMYMHVYALLYMCVNKNLHYNHLMCPNTLPCKFQTFYI